MLRDELKKRILILDGAMGTMIQKEGLTEDDFRGERFANWECPQMKGNNEVLCLTKPSVIEHIHRAYFESGADIIKTCTFNAQRISLHDYNMQDYVREINLAAGRIARKIADEFTKKTPHKPRFVVASIGPTNKTASISPDVENPAARDVTFDELCDAYEEQMSALLETGIDGFLIETIFDTLNAKAAVMAAQKAMAKCGKQAEIMLSATIADLSGRTLSGQTISAFMASMAHVPVLSMGLNCSFGADKLKPYIKEISEKAPFFVSVHPNAGLPNQFGEYDDTPEAMKAKIKEFIDEKCVNIIGGCCGTTPAHIATYSELLTHSHEIRKPVEKSSDLWLSGMDDFRIKSNSFLFNKDISTEEQETSLFCNIGERCNVAGTKKFLRLISEKNYDEALTIARNQVEAGAQVIDINMDDGMLDAKTEMTNFVNLIASDPEVARVPLMIDSSQWDVIEAGLKCAQGKCIVNSISLKEGEEKFLQKAEKIKRYGAATVVMAFDEQGQADTYERKIEICARAYRLLTEKIGFAPQDIIFDPNVLAIGTGIESHNSYGIDFIRATLWIKEHLPHAKVSGGVSNLSFSFRGNNAVREAMHSVFLYHARKAGMDMGIVNAGMLQIYDEINPELLQYVEDIVLNRRPDATDRMLRFSETLKQEGSTEAKKNDEWREKPLDDRLKHALIKGINEYMEIDLEEALKVYGSPLEIIKKPLMNGINEVGELFGQGKMFLPQVVKTARTMKTAVAYLQPYIEKSNSQQSAKAGKILMATVKGDVHDIGKNIVCVVMSCNNFDVIDLGVMVPTETIVEKAIELKADAIGLSGLITPSLDEMIKVVQALEAKGLKIPVMIGGATTSDIHTAVKIAPEYSGVVAYVKDASQNAYVASALINGDQKFIADLKKHQEEIRTANSKKKPELLPIDEAKENAPKTDWSNEHITHPTSINRITLNDIDLNLIAPLVNWRMLLYAWKLSGDFEDIEQIADENEAQQWLAQYNGEHKDKAEEAAKIIIDGKRILRRMIDEQLTTAHAVVQILPANSIGDEVAIYTDEQRNDERCRFHFLRQQKPGDDGHCTSLADYIAPAGTADYIGMFAATAGIGLKQHTDHIAAEGNEYEAIMMKLLADRLAEALSEWLHYQVRTKYWAYAPNEPFDIQKLHQYQYTGIRPAIGYPSIPQHEIKRQVFDLLNVTTNTHIELTETLGMSPAASVCGFYFANEKARYILVGDTEGQ
ncbi:MAG: methionine synthase [Paludibacteraceae bacterium]|nr:methionine synthase [Paludibacteraceae bacterium]